MSAPSSTPTSAPAATGETLDPTQPRAPWLKQWFKATPDDGWLTFVLLAAVVFSTVTSIQAVTPPWALGLSILTPVTAVGLILSYVVVQQRLLPPGLAHVLAIGLGVFFAYDQTAGAVLGDNRTLLLQRLGTWFHTTFVLGQGSNDNAVFLLFLAILTFLLAYISYWLVAQTRRPWLAVLANGAVLMINLNWATDSLVVYLILFLLAALLLLVRFTLTENMRFWRARGLRFSPDLSWDFMQAGAILAVVILLLAYLLPVGTANAQALTYLNNPEGAFQQVQERVAAIFGGVIGPRGSHGFAPGSDSIVLVGSVNLPQTEIMHYTVGGSDDPTQYLASATYDTYDGVKTWGQSATNSHDYVADEALPAPSPSDLMDTYNITLDDVSPNVRAALFAPGAVASTFSIPFTGQLDPSGNIATSWESQVPLKTGTTMLAAGYVPKATAAQLRAAPYPSQIQPGAPSTYNYPPEVLSEYLPTSNGYLSPLVIQTAHAETADATSMYDAAVDLENYLRTFTYSTQNPDPPSGQDATAWFLQQKQGYCTFFASAMALMGRALGMPTRMVSGFINGAWDPATNAYIVRGTASHAWTQIYFANYGWVNFEPTSTFETFQRSTALPTPAPTSATTTPSASRSPTGPKDPKDNIGNPGGPNSNGGSGPLPIVLGGSLILLFLLLLAALALTWWRLLFRGLPPAAAVFGRISRLGAWAGAPPETTQTPLEYADRLSELVPAYRGVFRQLGNAYARERYGSGVPSNLARQLPSLYDEVRGRLAELVGRRLLQAPRALLSTRMRRRHATRGADEKS